MTTAERYRDFWPAYLRAHSRPGNRWLHFAGTLGGLALLVAALVLRDWRFAVAAPVLGYAFAWTGHFALEGNRPATLGHPLWSFASDWRMLALWLTGRLDAELRRHAVPAAQEKA